MPASRRSLAGATLGAAGLGAVPAAAASPADAEVVAGLLRTSQEANAALMRGEIESYRDLLPYTANFMLRSPFGGAPTRGWELTPDRWARMGRFFRNGTFRQELVEAYVSDAMAVLAIVERPVVEVGGLPAQEWALRVTLVFRREEGAWRLALRHADPLVADTSWAQSAALARGERAG